MNTCLNYIGNSPPIYCFIFEFIIGILLIILCIVLIWGLIKTIIEDI